MGCKSCIKECIGDTPCKDCKKGMKVLLIPVAAFVMCYLIVVTI